MSSAEFHVARPTPTDNNPVKNKAVNAEDQLFWRRVREAYHMVSADSRKDIEVEVGDRHAHINARVDKSKSPPLKYIAVHIWEIQNKPPTLVVP